MVTVYGLLPDTEQPLKLEVTPDSVMEQDERVEEASPISVGRTMINLPF